MNNNRKTAPPAKGETMNIQIRINGNVPTVDDERIQRAIESILAAAYKEFPELTADKSNMNSPFTVTINRGARRIP